MKQQSSTPRGLLKGVHAAGLLFIVLPLVDVSLTVWPFRLDTQWRYGTTGLLSNYLLTPLLGLLLIGLTAYFARQRRILSVLGWMSTLAGVITLAAVALFGLDGLEVRGTVPPGSKQLFLFGMAKAIFKLSLMGLWMLGYGWAALRGARSMRAASPQADDASMIIRRPHSGSAAASE